ncbi:MAG TPA: 4-hydroxy-tetrahydrodipicolinate reductase, partial [Casimicrobiaceae bacterium]|nr:4-hydroxy-tetrahydrodipicolinate reductase [Casimicrobiaceae bacterium]
MIRVAIAGAGGRMGQALIESVRGQPGLVLAAAIDVLGAPSVGRDVGVVVGADVEAAVSAADVLVDFTRPAGTLAHLEACARRGVAAVVGTTGLDDAQKQALHGFGAAIPIVFAANMSVGVNVMLSLVEQAARALGADFDIEIVEMHHKHKIDAPSGTALMLANAAAAGRGIDLKLRSVRTRDGEVGARRRGDIG